MMKLSRKMILVFLMGIAAMANADWDCGSRLGQTSISIGVSFDRDGSGLKFSQDLGALQLRMSESLTVKPGKANEILCNQEPAKCVILARRARLALDRVKGQLVLRNSLQEEALQCAYLKTSKFQQQAQEMYDSYLAAQPILFGRRSGF